MTREVKAVFKSALKGEDSLKKCFSDNQRDNFARDLFKFFNDAENGESKQFFDTGLEAVRRYGNYPNKYIKTRAQQQVSSELGLCLNFCTLPFAEILAQRSQQQDGHFRAALEVCCNYLVHEKTKQCSPGSQDLLQRECKAFALLCQHAFGESCTRLYVKVIPADFLTDKLIVRKVRMSPIQELEGERAFTNLR